MIHILRAINAQMTDNQWITKEEAGIRLGSPERPLSGRRVHDLAKDGRLQSTLLRDPHTGHMAIRIHAGSVERYIFERDNPASDNRSELSDAPRGSRGPRDTRDSPLLELLRMIANGHANSARWMTLKEAEAYIGLPVKFLRELMDRGELPFVYVPSKRDRLRVRAGDLEQIQGTKHESISHREWVLRKKLKASGFDGRTETTETPERRTERTERSL